MERLRSLVHEAQERQKRMLENMAEEYISKAEISIREKMQEEDEFLCCHTISYVAVEITEICYKNEGYVVIGETYIFNDYEEPDAFYRNIDECSGVELNGELVDLFCNKLREKGFLVYYYEGAKSLLPFFKV